MPQVISTMTDSVEYTNWHHPEGGGLPEAINSVTIKGGANLAQKRLLLLGEGPSSKSGISTEVTDSELEFLLSHPLFQKQAEAGFLEVVKSSKADAEKVAKNMVAADNAAPITEADLDEKNTKARLKGHKLKSAKE